MLERKEIIAVSVIALILAFTISLVKSLEIFLYALLSIFLILTINIIAKKVMSFYLDSEIEIKLWEIGHTFLWTPLQGWSIPRKLKRPFPAGAFFPIIITAFSFGYLTWMASLVFDVKAKVYRAARRYGLYKFSEMTEYHLALIAAAGIIANLSFAIIGYLLGFNDFAKLNIYYASFNMLPISSLDGNKIFFGSLVLWSFLASIILIGLLFALLAI